MSNKSYKYTREVLIRNTWPFSVALPTKVLAGHVLRRHLNSGVVVLFIGKISIW